MAAPAGLGDAEPESVITGIVDILRAGDGTPETRKWVEVCSHSGFCIDACDYGVDPRLMMNLARLSLKRDVGEEGRRQGRESFFGYVTRDTNYAALAAQRGRSRPGLYPAVDGFRTT